MSTADNQNNSTAALPNDTEAQQVIVRRALVRGLKKNIQMMASAPMTLDVGIGAGELCREILAFSPAAKITGIDISSEALTICAAANITQDLKRADIARERLMFRDLTFDLSISTNVMEYVDNIGNAMQEMTRVTRRGGLVAFSYIAAGNMTMRSLIPRSHAPTDHNDTLFGHSPRKVIFYAKTLGLTPLCNCAVPDHESARIFVGQKK